ncbi:MAG: ribonuclease R [Bacteroidota bacterium]
MAKKKKNRKNIQKRERAEAKIRKNIVRFLRSRHDRAFNHKQIAAGADVRGRISHDGIKQILEVMADQEKIKRVGRGQYSIVLNTKTLEGKIEVTRDGFGFVVVEDQDRDIFIGSRRMGKALHGDTVKVRVLKWGSRDQRPEGEVLEILERGHEFYIGRIEILDSMAFFLADDARISRDFSIPKEHLGGAKDGDKVLMEILDWTHHSPEGKVIRVLGAAGENETEMHAILFQFGFQPEFVAEVEREAAAFPGKITAAEIKKRRDLRDVPTFTIDPPDAKDFDDALSFRELSLDRFEIGVHIADVSHYVKPGTALDKEAFNRATSVYLVDRTVPMLPERLSNDLCSLRPKEDKLTFSAIFELDRNGKVHKEWFGRTIIHSNHRFAYEEAQAVMDAGSGPFYQELITLNELAQIFQKARFANGSINFEDAEVKFELDEEGKPTRIYRKIRKDAHKLIEDWMLLANRRVCAHVFRMRKGTPPPFIYRVHDTPNEEKLFSLQQFAATLGYRVDLENPGAIAKSLNRLMQDVEGKPEQSLLQTVAVRTMAKAIYSTDNIGHYGLGFEFYSHFTSPIRRYPDLLVHRMLGQYLDGNLNGNPAELESKAKHCTNRERRAVEAERASIKHKQVEFLEDKVGARYEGLVSGVTSWGLYVELLENKCEGMVGLHSLNDDYYEVDSDNYCIRGRSTGTTITLGDKVMIEVKGTSYRNRTIDFTLVEVLESHAQDIPELAMAPAAPRNSRRKGGKRGSSRSGKHSRHKKKRR